MSNQEAFARDWIRAGRMVVEEDPGGMIFVPTRPDIPQRISCPLCERDDGYGTHLSRVDVASGNVDHVFDAEGEGESRREGFYPNGNVRGTCVLLVFTFERCHHQAALRFQFHKGAVYLTAHAASVDGELQDVWRT